MSGPRRNLLFSLAWFSGLFFILLAFWARCIRPYYVEWTFSEVASATSMFHTRASDWFLKPFSRYVANYPEWNPHLLRAFIRPGESFYYYLCSLLFGDNYAAYHLATYVCVAATCAFTFYIAAEILGLGLKLSCFLAALTFISPAYSQGNLFTNAYAADPLAGAWIMAAALFFLARRYFAAWALLCVAVGTKETAWSLAVGMAVAALLTLSGRLWQRAIGAFAFLLPLIALIALRIHDFGLHGAVQSDEKPRSAAAADALSGLHHAPSRFASMLKLVDDRFVKWPFGVLSQSRQYDHRFLAAFRILGSAVDIFFWAVLTFLVAALVARLARSGKLFHWTKKDSREWLPGYPPAFLPLSILTAASFVFPLRFVSDPRYGTGIYPLVYLTAGSLIAFHAPRLPRLTAWILILSTGLFGLSLRASDATYGVDAYRADWRFASAYLAAIQASAGHPLFIVDDILGGENNSEAYSRFFGPEIRVVRVNDLQADKNCQYLAAQAPPPISLSVTARRDRPDEISIRSVVAGCAGHSFLGAPQLPAGPLERNASGFHLAYTLNPKENPQPTEGPPRLLEATIQGAPPDSIVIAPDFASRTYVAIPVR